MASIKHHASSMQQDPLFRTVETMLVPTCVGHSSVTQTPFASYTLATGAGLRSLGDLQKEGTALTDLVQLLEPARYYKDDDKSWRSWGSAFYGQESGEDAMQSLAEAAALFGTDAAKSKLASLLKETTLSDPRSSSHEQERPSVPRTTESSDVGVEPLATAVITATLTPKSDKQREELPEPTSQGCEDTQNTTVPQGQPQPDQQQRQEQQQQQPRRSPRWRWGRKRHAACCCDATSPDEDVHESAPKRIGCIPWR